jgi:hypothetical protein
LQACGFGTGLVKLMKDNELLYIIEGIDFYGRRFTSAYNKEDADYLLASDRLNRLVATRNQRDTINS